MEDITCCIFTRHFVQVNCVTGGRVMHVACLLRFCGLLRTPRVTVPPTLTSPFQWVIVPFRNKNVQQKVCKRLEQMKKIISRELK
jgi:hypothetical protein